METRAGLVISGMLVGAGILGLVGSLRLMTLDDTLPRLHGPTKAATLAVGGVRGASMIHSALLLDRLSLHKLLIANVLFPTAPITATFIARAYMHRHLQPGDLPPTGDRHGWAVHDSVPEDERPIDTR